MAELIALYMAGLSFFFFGMSGVSQNLQQLSGQKFRLLLARATNHPVHAGLLGAIMGAITQSTSVVAFILAGMTESGLLQMGRALLVLACSNLGTALLVFVAATNLHLPILYLIGISGLVLAFKLFYRWKPAFAGLLSIGLIFFGLDMMKTAFRPLSSMPGFSHVGAFFDYWPDMAFFLGMGMRAIIHSSSAAAAVTITLNHGMMDEFPSMMSLAGLGAGTALATYLLSSNLRGVPRQVALFQGLGNFAAGVVMGVLLSVEHMMHVPMLMWLVNHLSQTSAGRMAFMYFLFNVLILAISLATLPWAPAWLAKRCPPTPEQDLSRPSYLQTQALNAPESALDLVGLEQLRILRASQSYLAYARGESKIDLKSMHTAAGILHEEISRFMEALVSLPIALSLATRIISFQRKQEILRSLEENIFLLSQTLQELHPMPITGGHMLEALDTITLTAIDALQAKDTMDMTLLIQMTEDRGPMMERIRNRMEIEEAASVGHVAVLHYATTLFERNVWLLRQLALWLREDRRYEEI